MVCDQEGEEKEQGWTEIVHLLPLFQEATAFEPEIFIMDFQLII